jgi:hypothetical protein
MIYFFGDSFTAGLCGDDNSGENIQYLDKTYGEYVAGSLNQPFEIHALPGACSMDIYQSLIGRLTKFKKGDTIIIGDTSPSRLQIPGIHWNNTHMFRNTYRKIEIENIKSRRTLVPWHNTLWWKESDLREREKILRSTLPEYTGTNLVKTGEAISLFVEDIMLRYIENYQNYSIEWFLSLKVYFDSIGVTTLYWDYTWWDYIIQEVKGAKCECGHWDDSGVELFANYVVEALNNGVGILKVPNKFLI